MKRHRHKLLDPKVLDLRSRPRLRSISVVLNGLEELKRLVN